MRGFVTYALAGFGVLIASALLAPQDSYVQSQGAGMKGVPVQSVNRAAKSDRLLVPSTTVGKQQPAPRAPSESPTMLVGCDPVFSPLSASAQANFPGRCMA